MNKCPNCCHELSDTHIGDLCLLSALAGVIQDRGEKSTDEILAIMDDVDPDALWSELGAIVDRLSDGEYSATIPIIGEAK